MIAVVLAGGKRDAVAERDPLAPNKAFVEVGGRALVARAIASLRGASTVERIVAVAPESARRHRALAGADEVRPSGTSIAESLRSGLAGLDPDEPVLIAASDLPILSSAAVDAFAGDQAVRDADIAYSCVERSVHEARFADVPHTWAHLREGDFCGGGLVALRPRAFDALERFLDRLGSARKNPLRLASIFGYPTLVAYAFRRLRIVDAERRAGLLLGFPVRAVVSPFADIAVNVDRPSDVALAERLVASASA